MYSFCIQHDEFVVSKRATVLCRFSADTGLAAKIPRKCYFFYWRFGLASKLYNPKNLQSFPQKPTCGIQTGAGSKYGQRSVPSFTGATSCRQAENTDADLFSIINILIVKLTIENYTEQKIIAQMPVTTIIALLSSA